MPQSIQANSPEFGLSRTLVLLWGKPSGDHRIDSERPIGSDRLIGSERRIDSDHPIGSDRQLIGHLNQQV
mgnify:CR=1 FL=1